MNRPIVLVAVALAAACSRNEPAAPAPSAAERRELRESGIAAYEKKDWVTCGALLERAEDWYDAACCHAQAGSRDRAFAMLDRAIEGGWHRLEHLQADPDLEGLHADSRWATTVDAVAAAAAAHRANLNAELLRLYEEDQADRSKPYDEIDWAVVSPRDDARQKRVDEILAAGGAKVADDYYHAAMVYQHGETPAEAQRAHDLALAAVGLDPGHDRAKWLAAAAEDRRLMYEKKPQKYGTQYTKKDGLWVLWEVDPAVTDAEREAWSVPSLAEAKAQADRMNSKP